MVYIYYFRSFYDAKNLCPLIQNPGDATNKNVLLSERILDEESDECGSEKFRGEPVPRRTGSVLNPSALLNPMGDLDTSGTVTDDWLATDVECCCRSSFFTWSVHTLTQCSC